MKQLFGNVNKKIIFASTLKEIDLVVKRYTLKYKIPFYNYKMTTISSLAADILKFDSKFSEYKILKDDEAKAEFYSFLNKNIDEKMIFGLIPLESLSYETANDAYNTINKIRNGKKIKSDFDNKIFDLIKSFEEYLSKNKLLDIPMILSNVNSILISDDDKKDSLKHKFQNVSLYFLPSLKNKLSYAETIFIESLSKLSGKSVIELKFDKRNEKIEQIKAPAYGYSNIIKFIISEIKEKNFNLNDVAIYTSNDSYNSLLKGYFDNCNINYYFENGESILSEDYADFFMTILDFLSNNFNIEYLYYLYINPALEYYDDGDKKHSFSAIEILKRLKADREQILKQANLLQHGKKDFLVELVNIYDEKDTVFNIYKKVNSFTSKYTKALSHKYCKELFDQKQNFFHIFDFVNDEYDKKVDLIKEIVSTIKIKKEFNKQQSNILISSISSNYLPRKYNFFIGLSANEMILSEVESPLISDDDIEKNVDCNNYYVELAKFKNKEFNNQFSDLLLTQTEGKQYFVTSVYDSVECKLLSPSSIYLIINGEEREVFFDNLAITINNSEDEDVYLFPQTNENKEKVNNTILSPTAVETIMNCPLKYIYSLIFDDIQFDNRTDKWLKGGEEGTFVHLILQKYFETHPNSNFDSKKLDECFDKSFDEIKINNPFTNESIQNAEASKIKAMVKKYLLRYYKELEHSSEKYQPIFCELKINSDDSVPYPAIPSIKIYGIIDRIDAFIDDNGDLKIKLIDYKTYSRASFDEHKRNNMFTQFILYPYLINSYINKNIDKIKSLIGQFNSQENYDVSFVYELLKTDESFSPDFNAVEKNVEESLKNYLLLIEKPTWQNFMNIYQPSMLKGNIYDKGKCGYCSFSRYCRFKMQKGDNKIWKTCQ